MSVVWQRLVRFVATDGRILRGEPILPAADFDLGDTTEATELQAKVIIGADPYDTTGKTTVTDEIVTVKRLLGPLAQEDTDILRCVGLNYAKHSTFLACDIRVSFLMSTLTVKEAGRTPPPFPFIFFKPTTCIADHDSNIVIPKIAQDDQADYEGELVNFSHLNRIILRLLLTLEVSHYRQRR